MPDNNGVTTSTPPVDDRGVPLQNLQAEFSRKLEEIEARNAERWNAINQKLDAAFTAEPEEPAPDPQSVDEREELRKISAAPRRYVEEISRPLREEIESLKQKLEKNEKLTVYGMWERQQDTIARLEGKKDWNELPRETQEGLISIVKEKGWVNNPSSAIDAYELYRARKINKEDPDRINRINSSTTEGSGRVSGKTPVRTLARSTIEEMASTHPKHPDYKKNMETLGRIQNGEIKVE